MRSHGNVASTAAPWPHRSVGFFNFLVVAWLSGFCAGHWPGSPHLHRDSHLAKTPFAYRLARSQGEPLGCQILSHHQRRWFVGIPPHEDQHPSNHRSRHRARWLPCFRLNGPALRMITSVADQSLETEHGYNVDLHHSSNRSTRRSPLQPHPHTVNQYTNYLNTPSKPIFSTGEFRLDILILRITSTFLISIPGVFGGCRSSF